MFCVQLQTWICLSATTVLDVSVCNKSLRRIFLQRQSWMCLSVTTVLHVSFWSDIFRFDCLQRQFWMYLSATTDLDVSVCNDDLRNTFIGVKRMSPPMSCSLSPCQEFWREVLLCLSVQDSCLCTLILLCRKFWLCLYMRCILMKSAFPKQSKSRSTKKSVVVFIHLLQSLRVVMFEQAHFHVRYLTVSSLRHGLLIGAVLSRAADCNAFHS